MSQWKTNGRKKNEHFSFSRIGCPGRWLLSAVRELKVVICGSLSISWKVFLFSWLVYFLKHVLCPPCIWNKFVVFIAMWPTVQESIETVCSSVKTSGVELKCSAKGKIVMIVALKTDFGQDGWLYYQRSSRSAILRKRKGRFQVELCQNVTRWSSFNGMASASDPALFTQFFPPLGFLSRRPKREIQSPFFYLANLQVDG